MATTPAFDPKKAEEDFRRDIGLKIFTTIWFLAILAACGFALMAVRNETFPYHKLNIANPATEKQAIYAFIGGVIGSGIYAFRGFCIAAGPQKYDNAKFHYDPNWTWWYIASPVIGGFLALVAYIVVRTGIGTLGSTSTDSDANAGYFAVGALAGLSTKKVLAWLDSISTTEFPGGKTKEEQKKTVTPAEAAAAKAAAAEVAAANEAADAAGDTPS